MGIIDEIIDGFCLGIGLIICIFTIIIFGTIIGIIFSFLLGGLCTIILLSLFAMLFIYRLFLLNFPQFQKKKSPINIRNDRWNHIDKRDISYNSFSISQKDYSNQIEKYTVKKNEKKELWS